MHTDPSHPVRVVCDHLWLQKRAVDRKDFEDLISDHVLPVLLAVSPAAFDIYLDLFMILTEQTNH